MPQEIKGTSSAQVQTNDNNLALPMPSPADNDKNQAMPRPDLKQADVQKAFFGIRKPDKSQVGKRIFDKE